MSEISPELAARIESLRASHAENPARFFMPLASAYREGGEVGKAEELLRENLKRHPGYLSAHVLLGRCLADRGADAEARNEFQYVLSVDPQNLIALRTLGEMAAASGDRGEARRWFGELLSVDPMNAEAKQSLAALDAPEAPAEGGEAGGFGMVEPGAGDAPAADHPAATADPGTWGEVSLDQHPSFSAGDAPAAGEPAAPSFEALDFGAVDLSAPGSPAEPQESAAPAEAASGGFASEEFASEEFASEDFAPGASGPAEAAAPGPAPTAGGFDAWGSVDDGQDAVDAAAVEPLELEEFYDADADADAAPEPAPAAHAEEHDEHEEVVTETIAELYARQGFPERAAGVYRELIARRGEEPALVRRLQELEDQVRAEAEAEREGDEPRFEPVDFPGGAAADETAAARADEPPSWLAAVDAVVAGDTPSATEAEAAPDDGGMFDLQPDEPQPAAEAEAEPIATIEEPAAPVALTGDAFADSFANGFAGVAGAPERREWEAPRVEETEAAADTDAFAAIAPVDAAADTDAFAAIAPVDAAADVPSAEAAEEPAQVEEQPAEAEEEPSAPRARGGESITSYLSAILAWRPGARADAAEAPADVAASEGPPPPRPWDDETLGASDEQPPIDEPWIAADSAPADAPPADEPWSAASPEPEPADEPWSAPAADAEPWAGAPPAEPEPWAASADEGGAQQDEVEELPWMTTDAGAGTDAPAAEEPMPWETSFELSPEVPEDGPGERPAPRQEPTVEPAGGFSFEDFFSEPVAPAQPAPEPTPEPEPEPLSLAESLPEPPPPPAAAQPAAAQPPAAEGGDEDEDLESFQAWLQSLKR